MAQGHLPAVGAVAGERLLLVAAVNRLSQPHALEAAAIGEADRAQQAAVRGGRRPRARSAEPASSKRGAMAPVYDAGTACGGAAPAPACRCGGRRIRCARDLTAQLLPAREACMPSLVPVLGLFVMLGIAWTLSANRSAIRWRPVAMGTALQIVFALIILKTEVGTERLRRRRRRRHPLSRLHRRRRDLRLRREVQGVLLRLQGPADDHLLLELHHGALLLRHPAEDRQRLRQGDDEDDGHLGRRVALGLGQHLRRPDRGAAAHQALCRSDDQVGAHGGDDRRLRHRRRRRDGGLRRHGGFGEAPARGERDVGAGRPGDGEADVPRDREERRPPARSRSRSSARGRTRSTPRPRARPTVSSWRSTSARC